MSFSPIVVSPFMQLRACSLVCVGRYGFLLNHGSEITTAEHGIREVEDVAPCPEYPSASIFCFVCRTFSFFCWTCFWMSSGPIVGSEMPAREILGARPVAEASTVNMERRHEQDIDGAQRAVPSNRPSRAIGE